MHQIYDSGGSVHAWLDEDVVRNLGGSVVALVMDGDRIVDTSGRNAGWFEDGWLEDVDGHALGFLSDAGPGPAMPMKGLTPLRPLRGLRPLRPVRPVKPIEPVRSRSWARLRLDDG